MKLTPLNTPHKSWWGQEVEFKDGNMHLSPIGLPDNLIKAILENEEQNK